MSIEYYKLFDLLNRKGMKKSDLRAIMSSATIAKLSKGEYISGEAIDKICSFLKCQPGDIMEWKPDYDFEELSAAEAFEKAAETVRKLPRSKRLNISTVMGAEIGNKLGKEIGEKMTKDNNENQ